MSVITANFDMLSLSDDETHSEAHSEPNTTTATATATIPSVFDSRHHSPSQIASCPHLRKSSSGSALSSQTADKFLVPSAPISSIPSPPPVSSTPSAPPVSSTPSAPPVSSTPSTFVSSHHHDSSSTSTIHPPQPPDLTPVFYPNPFSYLTAAHPAVTYQPHYWQSYLEVAPQVYYNAVDVDPQYYLYPNTFEPNLFPPLNTEMAYPFGLAGTTNYVDFERYESCPIEELLQQSLIPFGGITDMNVPPRDGVLMISNIPYTVSRHEVSSFLGKNAYLLPSSEGCPIHIIMERSTGKTMDIFVEFSTKKDAQDTFDRITGNAYDAGSAPRIGSRHVDIEMSSPAKLLQALFPQAKCISWETGKPIQVPNKDSWSTGFNGFLTDEELFCLTRLSEQPHRSVFASKVPQRCYESFISTIWKFPWQATHLYTVHHRNALFKTLGTMIKTLVERMQKTNTVGLDVRLLNELVYAGICCPAFNPRMKYCFAWWSQDMRGIATLDHDWCLYFPFDTMTYVHGHPPTAIQFYAYLMSHGVVLRTENDGLINKHTHPEIERIFGRFWFEWDDEAARNTIYKDAANYEASVLRKFIITGFQHLHKRNSSISTIGTAPPDSSPTHSTTSVDSERTISASRSRSMNPSAASQQGSSFSTARNMPGSVDDGNNWNAPGHTRGISQRLDADQYLPDTPTRRAPPSVRPYRPPHHREVSEAARDWRMPRAQQAPAAASSENQAPVRPIYRAPHLTAHNVRSSSDPFAPGPSVAPSSHRSRSDAARLSTVDRQAFDDLRAARRGKAAQK
ncbi:Nucleotide-binding alpha-beta plait [Penicillium concentricum]|uniref:Nucleotide-binding alpha-beta plait n=1 Tax=Penicillium concentricum TaxID=293559 RepID=A0A9W9V474_9EURO|nr:Nucleotide-binding alpha-beta plait [Penicillium concentricum]KAJ5365636.1 Nucleotide-binding alpha-beta plait [Penicillium concentricum]